MRVNEKDNLNKYRMYRVMCNVKKRNEIILQCIKNYSHICICSFQQSKAELKLLM